MEKFKKIVRFITNLNKWVAFSALTIMFPIVFVFSIARTLGHPIIGDIELVQFGMVLLIMGSLAITEAANSHISIGLLVDRFPQKLQLVINFIAQILTISFCFVVCLAFITNMNYLQTSDLLKISYVPFKFFVIIGFAGWGLEAILKLILGVREGRGTVG